MTRKARTMGRFSALTLAFVTLAGQTQVHAQTTTGPTATSALSTDTAVNQALLTGDAGALKALLADDWIVVSGFGSIADKNGFIDFIRKSGARKTMILSEPRVRLYGDTALVTTHLDAVGPFVKEVNGKLVRKCFAVKERQTDVLVWNDGGWKSVLLHETTIPPGPKVSDASSACT
ncbi:MAG: nuclear transport factor 2 family protein [Candidatus Cybelea sp.]